jgi:hypothetical protein
MRKERCFLVFTIPLFLTGRALACEPVIPFMQAMMPALAFSRSIVILVMAVVVKSILFSVFDCRLPRPRAAWRMFLGNVLTSLVGLLVAIMLGSGAAWIVGAPLAYLLCWLPARRLVKEAPLPWLARLSPALVAGIMTMALLASCFLFMAGQEVITTHRLTLYWILKLVAIALALFASVALTTIWEEWVIWRLSSGPVGTNFFVSALRANLYVLMLVLAVPAVLILPKRLKSPDFLAKRACAACRATARLSH